MRDGSVDELTGKINELTGKKRALEKQLRAIKGGRFYQGQISDINQLQGQIDEYGRRIDIATRARTLVINIVEKRHKIGGIEYQSTRTGRLVPINPPETVSQQREREERERLANQDLGITGGPTGGSSGGGGSSAVDTLKQQMEAGEQLSRQFEEQKQL